MNIRKYFNPDKIVGTSAFIISLGTFLALVYQARISHEQAELSREQAKLNREQAELIREQGELNRKALYNSMLPYLHLYNTQLNTYELVLENNGLGPAFIQDIRVHYKGKIYEGDHNNFLLKVILPTQAINYHYTNIGKGMVIPAGRKISLVVAHDPVINTIRLREIFEKQTATLEITYSSVYDEKWKLDGMKPPQKLK